MDVSIAQLAKEAAYAVSDLLDEDNFDAFDALTDLEKVIWRYHHADCDDFALVLHEATGWPVVGVIGPTGPLHRLNQAPDGRLVDAAGWVTSEDLASRYRTRITFTPADAEHVCQSLLYDSEDRLHVLAAMLHLPTSPFADDLRDVLTQYGRSLVATRSPWPSPAALHLVRAYLPQCWEWTHENFARYGQRFALNKQLAVPEILSTNMCRHTTLFLRRLFESAGIDGWRVAGGFMRTSEGFNQPHYWLENGNFIVDLTADQFGWKPIEFTPVTDERYQKQAAMSKNSAVTTLKTTIVQWEGTGASFWQERDPRFQKMKTEYPLMAAQFAHLCGPDRRHDLMVEDTEEAAPCPPCG